MYKRQVWDAEGTGNIHFNADEINQPVLGHIVENRLVAYALLHKIRQHNAIELIAPAKLDTIEQLDDQKYQLSLDGGQQLSADLLVAADGANSKVRSLAEINVREWDYDQHAIVATVKTERAHQQTAWQRFLPEGPLAFLPLATADKHCLLYTSPSPRD